MKLLLQYKIFLGHLAFIVIIIVCSVFTAYGESIITWSNNDFEDYKRFCNETDSLLITYWQS